jgi:hypothetical protein
MAARPSKDDRDSERSSSLIRRSWVAVSDILSPFSSAALASLPNPARPVRYTRADAIPDTDDDGHGHRPAVRDYHAINSVPPLVRVPKKIATPVKVEAKVWFANERSQLFASGSLLVLIYGYVAWVAWLNVSVLLGTLSLALFNASKDQVATNFAYVYALTSIGVLVCVLALATYSFPDLDS